MALKVKPKSFGPVFVVFDGDNSLRYAMSDPSELSACPPSQTPVDTLIASLGSCIVKSVQWVARQRKIALNRFTVKVVGVKAPDLPGRVERMEVTIIGNPVEDAALVPGIVTQAKSICTVSNTLNCEVTVSVVAAASA